MEQEKINRLQWILDDAVARGEIPGAILMVRKEGKETVYLESGYADIEAKKPVSRDSIYRLYSMSKPITATAVMILVERGLIDLADPVCRYLPGFCGQMVAAADGHVEKPWRDVTIQDLVNMTSGLVYDGNHLTGKQTEALFAEVIQGLDEGEGGAYGTVEIANRLGQIPLAFQPARSWCYGTSADVAGALVEVVSGMRFGDFLEKEIFTPLEMVDTGFWVPEEKQSRLVKTYECNEGKPSLLYTGNHLGIRNAMDRRPAFESGGAGLVSTIDDYSHFAQMLLNGGSYKGKQILSPAMVRFMTGHVLSAEQQEVFEREGMAWLEGFSYGNFMRVLVNPGRSTTLGSKGEYGWDGWLGCYFTNAPQDQMTILMMTQKKDSGTFRMTRLLRNTIYNMGKAQLLSKKKTYPLTEICLRWYRRTFHILQPLRETVSVTGSGCLLMRTNS